MGADINFSEDEVCIGIWIDGKKLYRKVYAANKTLSNTETNIFSVPSDVDTIVNLYGTIVFNSVGFTPINAVYDVNQYQVFCDIWQGSIRAKSVCWTGEMPIRVIIEYTKV